MFYCSIVRLREIFSLEVFHSLHSVELCAQNRSIDTLETSYNHHHHRRQLPRKVKMFRRVLNMCSRNVRSTDPALELELSRAHEPSLFLEGEVYGTPEHERYLLRIYMIKMDKSALQRAFVRYSSFHRRGILCHNYFVHYAEYAEGINCKNHKVAEVYGDAVRNMLVISCANCKQDHAAIPLNPDYPGENIKFALPD